MTLRYEESKFLRRDLRQRADYFANPAVKRTYTGGAHLCSHRAIGALVHVAYLVRWPHFGGRSLPQPERSAA